MFIVPCHFWHSIKIRDQFTPRIWAYSDAVASAFLCYVKSGKITTIGISLLFAFSGNLRVPQGVGFFLRFCNITWKISLSLIDKKRKPIWPKTLLVTCSGFQASKMLQLHKWPILTACSVLHAKISTISLKLSTCKKKRHILRECHWQNFIKSVWVFFHWFLNNKTYFLN